MRALVRHHPVATFLGLAFAFSWLAWLPLLLVDWGVQNSALAELHLLGSLGPAAAALLVAGLAHGRAGLGALVRRTVQIRSSWGAILAAVAAAGLVFVGAVAGSWIGTGRAPSPSSFLILSEYPWMVPVVVIAAEIFIYGFGEEIGWRGFLLPRLARRHGILLATSLGSIPWAVWHLPLLLHNETYHGLGAILLVGWYSTLLLGSFALTLLWRLGHKAIVPLAILHGLLDLAVASPELGTAGQVGGSVAMVILGIGALAVLKRRQHASKGFAFNKSAPLLGRES